MSGDANKPDDAEIDDLDSIELDISDTDAVELGARVPDELDELDDDLAEPPAARGDVRVTTRGDGGAGARSDAGRPRAESHGEVLASLAAEHMGRYAGRDVPPLRANTNLDGDLDAAFDAIATPTLPRPTFAAMVCPTCSGPVDLKSRHVAVHAGAVRVYCSDTCLQARDAIPAEAQTASIALPPKRRKLWWAVFATVVAGACVTGFLLTRELREMRETPMPPAPAISIAHPIDPPPPAPATDPQQEADAALVKDLMHDAWIHPLAGPNRRMPINHTGAFGAERAGERPPECVSGHCGVDVGNVWGEHVYAVHDGVVDFVNRGPNEERGGVFVRIAHRDGTLFSWYFHLAAVPRWVQPGVKIKAGDVIGLLGDTGIKQSAPHLHFALTVKPPRAGRERYIDPEPLLALWPLWIPNESRTGGTLSTNQEPGVPVRETGRRKSRPATDATAATSSGAPAAGSESSPSSASPAAAPSTGGASSDASAGTTN
jgi:hypothetical protein